MKAYSSRQVIRLLESHGWYVDRITGSHHIFKHPDRTGRVVVPHPRGTIPTGTFRSIIKQAGIEV